MSAGKVKCQFFSVFFPTEVIYRLFQWSLRKKTEKCFYVVCMYVRPKLTFVSFFCFFMHPGIRWAKIGTKVLSGRTVETKKLGGKKVVAKELCERSFGTKELCGKN